jgi:hypothetical protein
MLSIGIIGLPNVGKSTLFNSLTKSEALIANYPFATIGPNVGIVNVPDSRLIKLAELYETEQITPSTIKFIDIAGLVKGANKGEGLGNQFLSNIRSTGAIIQVVRSFSDQNVIHVNKEVNPKNDIDIINTELMLADLSSLSKIIPKYEKEAKANKKLETKLTTLRKIYDNLDHNIPGWNIPDLDNEAIKDLDLLTLKPIIYVFNLDENELQDEIKKAQLQELVAPKEAVFICAKLENELKELDPKDQAELLHTYGQTQSGLTKLIHSSYKLLGLTSYLTAGKKEVRSWTIKKGSTAPEAAGVIHNDFQRGFIAAEIVSYSDLIESGSWNNAKSQGKVRTEGKTYIMQEDDVVEFRFNV